jgi:hypothetical protein
MAKEMLEAWFETEAGHQGDAGVQLLNELDAKYRR